MAFDRLTALDSSFLHLETPVRPMHVGSLGIFEGGSFFDGAGRFKIDEARRVIAGRLHLVPRFRRKLMHVPLGQGRPIWVDDPAFDLTYHVRLTALPRPGNEEQLKALMGRLQGQLLDRKRPLWELWFVEGLEGDRVAVIQKTHHALVDGVSGVDVATVILDLEPTPPPADAPGWVPEPAPSPGELLVATLLERGTQPAEMARSARAALRGPRRVAEQLVQMGRTLSNAARVAPSTPLNVPIGPHRRFEVLRIDLDQAKAIKRSLGGTVNDVILASAAGGLRHFLLQRDEPVDGLTLKAMVPVSVRAASERMLLGNRVSALFADLPVGERDPLARLRSITAQMTDLKDSQQAVGADALMELARFAPPTLLDLAARLVPRQRAVNVVVTNIPGPQFPLYCMGARLLEAFPYVGPIDGVALLIGILSYDGHLFYGLSADRDVVPDLAVVAEGIEKAVAELAGRA